MNYDDARDFMMREQYGDDYITPTFAYTGNEWAEGCEEYGEDVMLHVMEKDMERYENERAARDARKISYLQDLLHENGIDYED